MTKPYSLSLHIFRRDLRLHDNTALIEALKLSQSVIPCFIFDKRQIEQNDYKSDNCIQFMVNSLSELNAELQQKQSKLYYFYGTAEKSIAKLLEQLPIQAVFLNRDYTPFSKERDRQIEKICHDHHVAFHSYADVLLHEPEEILKKDKTPYTIFTPFFKKSLEFKVESPRKNTHGHYYQGPIAGEDQQLFIKLSQKKNPNLFVKGGRSEALSLLKKVKTLSNYEIIRDFPALNGTTKLSAHNKFGTISIREFYAEVVKNFDINHPLIRELHWRDFFTHIGFHYPHVFGKAFHHQYDHLPWRHNEKSFRTFCEGRTGFPIVDAGIRELNTTGFMHNRVRMIVASFLTKDLQMDWRLGEKYFAQHLIDYDPAVNNGNWQWAASTGCDAQPYFRIFNPWLQQEKFDPECLYIKRWINELAHLPPKTIHSLNRLQNPLMTNYPPPMLDHAKVSQQSKNMYKNTLKVHK